MRRRVFFYTPHLGQSGGVAHILRFASGLLSKGWDAWVIDLSDRAMLGWFEFPIQVQPTPSPSIFRDSDIHVMYGDGPGNLLAPGWKKILFRMNYGVWNTEDEESNLRMKWNGSLNGVGWLRDDSERRGIVPAIWAPAGLDSRFNAPDLVNASRDPLGVGFLAHPAPFKRTSAAIAAVEEAKKTEPGICTYAYGPAASPLINTHIGRPSFELLRDLYRACTIWLMPSEREGFALPPLEAAACGAIPINALEEGRPFDFPQAGQGFQVPLSSFPELIVRLLKDKDLQASLQKQAMKGSGEFTWDSAIEKVHKYLQSIPF